MSTLLLVDSNHVVRRVNALNLRQTIPGLAIQESQTAEDALARLNTINPDLVLVDWETVNGNAAFFDRVVEQNSGVRIILTRSDDQRSPLPQMAVEIDEVLKKPVERAQLAIVVNRSLSRSAALRQAEKMLPQAGMLSPKERVKARLRRLQASLRAMEADLLLEADNPEAVRRLVVEYVSRLVRHTQETSRIAQATCPCEHPRWRDLETE